MTKVPHSCFSDPTHRLLIPLAVLLLSSLTALAGGHAAAFKTAAPRAAKPPLPASKVPKPRLLVFWPSTEDGSKALRAQLDKIQSLDIAVVSRMRHLTRAIDEEEHAHVLLPKVTAEHIGEITLLAESIPSAGIKQEYLWVSSKEQLPKPPLTVGTVDLAGRYYMKIVIGNKDTIGKVRTVGTYQDMLSMLSFGDVDCILLPKVMVPEMRRLERNQLLIHENPPIPVAWQPAIISTKEKCNHQGALKKALAQLDHKRLFHVEGWQFN